MLSIDLDHLEDDEFLYEIAVRNLNIDAPNVKDVLQNRMLTERGEEIPWSDTVRVIRSVNSEVALLRNKLEEILRQMTEAHNDEDFNKINRAVSRIYHVFNRINRLMVAKGELTSVVELAYEMRKAEKKVKLFRHSTGAAGLEASGGLSAPATTPTSEVCRPVTETVVAQNRSERPTSFPMPVNARPTMSMRESVLQIGQQEFLSSFIGRNSMPFSDPAVAEVALGGQRLHQINQGQNPPYQVNDNRTTTRGLGQPMSKWRIRYGGTDGELAIDEFLFRVENLALADGISQQSLVLGLHFILVGSASNFYWVQRRKRPEGTWQQYRQAFLEQFSTQETDFEIRKAISDRKQGQREDFGEFVLEMERLVARMQFPMEDNEVSEILKFNMLPYLQNAIWLSPQTSLTSLKQQCRRMEKLRKTQEDGKERRNRIAEIELHQPMQQNQQNRVAAGQSVFAEPNIQRDEFEFNEHIEAITNRRNFGQNSREYLICWNCDDIGHSYADCAALERRIFCYGCGTKNVIKPQCARCCQSGNLRSNVVNPGMLRSRMPDTAPKMSTNTTTNNATGSR